jgi:hypothetical protein
MVIVVCTGPYREAQELQSDAGRNKHWKVGPNICTIMNEICFGTATTQSRIPSEICGVSDPSCIYENDQNPLSIAPELKVTALTS